MACAKMLNKNRAFTHKKPKKGELSFLQSGPQSAEGIRCNWHAVANNLSPRRPRVSVSNSKSPRILASNGGPEHGVEEPSENAFQMKKCCLAPALLDLHHQRGAMGAAKMVTRKIFISLIGLGFFLSFAGSENAMAQVYYSGRYFVQRPYYVGARLRYLPSPYPHSYSYTYDPVYTYSYRPYYPSYVYRNYRPYYYRYRGGRYYVPQRRFVYGYRR